jgi:hypothetical protein
MFTPVIRDVDERGLELHQRIKVLKQGVDVFSLQRRQNFIRQNGILGLVDVIDYFHICSMAWSGRQKYRLYADEI